MTDELRLPFPGGFPGIVRKKRMYPKKYGKNQEILKYSSFPPFIFITMDYCSFFKKGRMRETVFFRAHGVNIYQ